VGRVHRRPPARRPVFILFVRSPLPDKNARQRIPTHSARLPASSSGNSPRLSPLYLLPPVRILLLPLHADRQARNMNENATRVNRLS